MGQIEKLNFFSWRGLNSVNFDNLRVKYQFLLGHNSIFQILWSYWMLSVGVSKLEIVGRQLQVCYKKLQRLCWKVTIKNLTLNASWKQDIENFERQNHNNSKNERPKEPHWLIWLYFNVWDYLFITMAMMVIFDSHAEAKIEYI